MEICHRWDFAPPPPPTASVFFKSHGNSHFVKLMVAQTRITWCSYLKKVSNHHWMFQFFTPFKIQFIHGWTIWILGHLCCPVWKWFSNHVTSWKLDTKKSIIQMKSKFWYADEPQISICLHQNQSTSLGCTLWNDSSFFQTAEESHARLELQRNLEAVEQKLVEQSQFCHQVQGGSEYRTSQVFI